MRTFPGRCRCTCRAALSGMLSAMEPIPDDPALRPDGAGADDPVPLYLRRTYSWAYLDRRTLGWLDRPSVVSAILWGNAHRLMQAAVAAFRPGSRVLQAACVYGGFSAMLARRVGSEGRLEVVDVAPLQVANARRKLAGLPQASVRRADLAGGCPGWRAYDGVCCFFLLHEVPATTRSRIVGHLLDAVAPGGRVVFVDYHRPHARHPLRWPMAAVFRWLEPYAESLLDTDIATLSAQSAAFSWQKRTLFGGLYQIVIGDRRDTEAVA